MGKNASDLELISQTVQDYFDGMYYRDIGRLRKAFHPKAYLFGYRNGECLHISGEEWFHMAESRPVPAESGEEYDMQLVSTDVTGAVATVKVTDLYQGMRFTDYLTLLKSDESWLIINKAFPIDPKS